MYEYQEGGTVGGTVDPLAGAITGTESSLSSWAGPYVTEMLGRGQALAEMPYQAYQGPLTAGSSQLQQQAYQGLAGLSLPQNMGAFTPTSFTTAGAAQQYMSPYLQAALEPQLAEAQRQAEIQRVQQAGRLTRAGAFGGGRQAIMESEGARNLTRQLSDITGTGYQRAFESAQQQFNTEQERQQRAQELANRYGLDVAGAQRAAGGEQRAIEQQGITADIGQFEEERDYPYKQVQYMQSLLQGLPIETQSRTYAEPSGLASFLGGAGGILEFLQNIGLIPKTTTPTGGTTTPTGGTTTPTGGTTGGPN